MPFADCQECGRNFHYLDPAHAAEASGNWPSDRDTRCPECRKAALDNNHNPVPNENAAHTVAELTAKSSDLSVDAETAWAEWASHIQNVDERGMTLLRAAFEAGWSAGQSN